MESEREQRDGAPRGRVATRTGPVPLGCWAYSCSGSPGGGSTSSRPGALTPPSDTVLSGAVSASVAGLEGGTPWLPHASPTPQVLVIRPERGLESPHAPPRARAMQPSSRHLHVVAARVLVPPTSLLSAAHPCRPATSHGELPTPPTPLPHLGLPIAGSNSSFAWSARRLQDLPRLPLPLPSCPRPTLPGSPLVKHRRRFPKHP